MFKSLSHFEFIFVHGVRVCSNFIDLHAAVQLSQHHLLKIKTNFFNRAYTVGLGTVLGTEDRVVNQIIVLLT